VVITDIEGRIEYVNPYFEELTGYKLQEVIGQKPNVLKSGYQDESFYSDLWNTILSGETWKGVFKNLKKNGQAYWESAVISPVKDQEGQIINFVALKQDISLQKRVQDRLNRENEYKSSLLRSIPEVIIVVDPDGVIQDFKGDEHDLSGQNFIRVGNSIWDVFDSDNSRLIFGHLKQLGLKSEVRHFKIQIHNETESKIFEIRMVRINAYRYMLTASDVTKAEKDLLDLKEASRVMKEQNERLQLFTFTVSHHLRSHTANIEAIFNLLQIVEPELMNHPFIKLLHQSAHQLSNTIQDLNKISDSLEKNVEIKK
jgi:PAS domain S-box-containing protein